MALKRINPGKRMSEAVIHNGMAYLAGFVADAAAGKSVKEQTTDILNQIEATLKKAGSNKLNIVKANIWLTDMSTFGQMNEAWDAWVVAGITPARATVESPRLAAAGLDVEIMVEAAIVKKAAAKKVAKTAAKKTTKKGAKKTAKRK